MAPVSVQDQPMAAVSVQLELKEMVSVLRVGLCPLYCACCRHPEDSGKAW